MIRPVPNGTALVQIIQINRHKISVWETIEKNILLSSTFLEKEWISWFNLLSLVVTN